MIKQKLQNSLVSLTAATLLALLAAGCNKGDIAGTTTETVVSGKTMGLIFLADGKPASGASIKVLKVGYRPLQDSGASTSFRTLTDKDGRYYVDSLDAGDYNILSELNGLSAYQDSVFLSGTARTLASDTLNDPGVKCGYVALEPGDPVRTVTIQVLGTQAYANVDAKGFFTLPKLAPGIYSLAVSTSLPDYTTLFAPVEINAGKKDTLTNTLRPIYSGIPQVMSVKVEYDTLAGQVKLTWPPSDYSNLDEYLIYRDIAGSPQRTTVAIAAVVDTEYSDNVFSNLPLDNFNGFANWSDTVFHLQYRIALRDNFGHPGRTFGAVSINAPSPAYAITFSSLTATGLAEEYASIYDTLHFVLQFRNRTRSIQKVEWSSQGQAMAKRVVSPNALDGSDSLEYICTAATGDRTIQVKLTDDAGMVWEENYPFKVTVDAPRVKLSGPAGVSMGTEMTLSARAIDDIGKIAKWEWDIGAKGTFITGSGKDTTFTAPDKRQVKFPCVVRVTDDDGIIATDTFFVNLVPWKKAAPLPYPVYNAATVSLLGKVYLIGGSTRDQWGNWSQVQKTLVYDPGTNIWSESPAMINGCSFVWAVAGNSKIYAFGDRSPAGNYASLDVEEFDPVSGAWTQKTEMPKRWADFQPVYLDGKIQILGGHYAGGTPSPYPVDVQVYDLVLDTWTTRSVDFTLNGFLAASTIGEKAYVLTNDFISRYSIRSMAADDQNLTALSKTDLFSTGPVTIAASPMLTASNGKLFVAGGVTRPNFYSNSILRTNRIQTFDPATNAWSDWFPFVNPKQPDYFASTGTYLVSIGSVADGNGDPGDPLLVETAVIGE